MHNYGICFICSEYPPFKSGGIGVFTKTLAERLIVKGWTVKVIGLYPGKSSVEEINGVHLYKLGRRTGHFMWIFDLLRIRSVLRSWVKEKSIDIIEDNDWDSYSGFLLGLNFPIVYRIHAGRLSVMKTAKENPFVKNLLVKLCIRKAFRIVGVSNTASASFQRIYKCKKEVKTIYNGVIVPDKMPDFNNRIKNLVIFVGTLNKTKGVVQLIKAWNIVIGKVPNARLLIFGKDGAFKKGMKMSEHLMTLLEKNKHSVEYKNHVQLDELYRAYESANLLVAPSIFESFSLVSHEAMAFGCPTIFTKLTSGPETIENEVEGLLIDPNNEEEIADAIIRVLSDDNFARYISENGHLRVSRDFNIKNTMLQNEALYISCIKSYFN